VSGDATQDLIVASPLFDGIPFSNDTRDSGAVYIVLGQQGPDTPGPDCADKDGDGFTGQGRTCGPQDCDDQNPAINPDAPEICTDGVDNDCDGFADADGEDVDGDGWPGQADTTCQILDCDDDDPTINPGMPEDCTDGIDNNCDGFVGGEGGLDNDGDGFPGEAPDTCIPLDCDDNDPEINPQSVERCADGIDNNCDGVTDRADPGCEEDPDRPLSEVCSNCVDDDGNGLGDLLDAVCAQLPLDLKVAKVKRLKKSPAVIKRVFLKGLLPDTDLYAEAAASIGTGGGLIVALSFEDGSQFCLSLDRVKRGPTGSIVLRSSTRPKAQLLLKPTRKARLRVRYKQKGKIQLLTESQPAIAFGIYGASRPYSGVAALRKNRQTNE
jgi:hypothetical protein